MNDWVSHHPLLTEKDLMLAGSGNLLRGNGGPQVCLTPEATLLNPHPAASVLQGQKTWVGPDAAA